MSDVRLRSLCACVRSGECVVCADSKPLALLLRTLEAPEHNTDDFAINYPLAVGEHAANADVLSPAVICGDCAAQLSTCPFSRAPLTVLPLHLLDLSHHTNRQHLLEVRTLLSNDP